MSIPTSGSAALLVVVMLALASCSGDDAATETQVAGPAAVETVTQTATATATAPQDEASKPAATTKTATRKQTTTRSGPASGDSPATSPQRPRGACQPVEVGAREGEVESTYARIDEARKVDCATAAYVASQWGSRQLGIGKALLPPGWECTKGNVCTNGSQRVTFELVRRG